jgi:hypothetical protein
VAICLKPVYRFPFTVFRAKKGYTKLLGELLSIFLKSSSLLKNGDSSFWERYAISPEIINWVPSRLSNQGQYLKIGGIPWENFSPDLSNV